MNKMRIWHWKFHSTARLCNSVVVAGMIVAFNCVGQQTVTMDLSGPAPKRLVAVSLGEVVGLVEGLPRAHRDGAIRLVLEGGTSAAKQVLTLAVGELRGVSTIVDGSEDILLAEWATEGGGRPDKMILWDTPRFAVFFLHWRVTPFRNSDEVLHFTHETLRWSGLPQDVRIQMHWDSQTQSIFGRGETMISPIRGGHEIQIFGELTTSGYVCAFVFGKKLVEVSYKNSFQDFSFVSERFPPLRERIKAWSNADLGAALDDGNAILAVNRDEILIAELLKREITDSEFRKLLLDPGLGPTRVYTVMAALEKTGRARQYASAIRDILLAQRPGSHHSEEMVRVILQAMVEQDDVDLCEAAGTLLGRREFIIWPYSYLAARGYTQGHYDVVSQAALPKGWASGRDRALKQIEDRIRKSGR